MSGLTDVPGIEVGHAEDLEAATGLTVILCPGGAVGGRSVRGGSTSMRQMGALTPGHAVSQVHAVLLTGGSGFGLGAAQGVLDYLEERGVGFDVGVTRVPIVPCAALFDLKLGDAFTRPGPEMAEQACRNAAAGAVAEGSVGAGCGATVGKLYGVNQATKGGLGTASVFGPRGLIVGGLVAVNSFGDVVDPKTGLVRAGARTSPDGKEFADTEARIKAGETTNPWSPENTTLALVATNARLTRSGCMRMAQMAELGLSRVIRPYGTMPDGDLVIALSVPGETEGVEADIHTLGLLAAEVLERAVIRAIEKADGLGLILAAKDLE